ncbi:MAG TPA: hypothetical protein VGE53_02675 [Candidatus Paceibacterota bacterium]
MKRTPQRGYLMLMAIVFGAIFVTVLGALTGFVLTENRLQSNATSMARATAIAEAGIEYYRWFLAHYPNDLQNGTGQPGPYSIPYQDPEGGQTGTISLSVTGNSSCGTVTSVDLRSTGTPSESPTVSRTILARYARPTVAQYAYVLNSTVWAGEDRVILGPYHSNGGIRMDGTANSPVTSSLSSWICNSDFGCSGNQTKPGVWGAGTNQSLWEYPVPQVDFSGIAADFSALKTKALASGRHLPRFSNSTNVNNAGYWRGYHLIFNSNGTVSVYRVSNTSVVDSQQINAIEETDDYPDRTLISSESFYQTLTLPSDCALIFVEDHVWIEGIVSQKVTVVSATPALTNVKTNVMLPGNLRYAATDGSDGLTVISENNILITPNSPQNMTLNGIFVAQGGSFGRNRYACPSSYEPRTSLTILGTTVSNMRTGTQWQNGCWSAFSGYTDAGYQSRVDSFDRKLSTDPPPFTPQTSTDYQFVDWREE